LAMMTLEILRMAIGIATWGMGRAAYLAYWAVVLIGLVIGGIAAGMALVRALALENPNLVGAGFLQHVLELLVRFNASHFGYVALLFRPFIDLALADSLTIANASLAFAEFAMVMGLAVAVTGLYTATSQRMAHREKRAYAANRAVCEERPS